MDSMWFRKAYSIEWCNRKNISCDIIRRFDSQINYIEVDDGMKKSYIESLSYTILKCNSRIVFLSKFII